MEYLPTEVHLIIAHYLPDDELIDLCRALPGFYARCGRWVGQELEEKRWGYAREDLPTLVYSEVKSLLPRSRYLQRYFYQIAMGGYHYRQNKQINMAILKHMAKSGDHAGASLLQSVPKNHIFHYAAVTYGCSLDTSQLLDLDRLYALKAFIEHRSGNKGLSQLLHNNDNLLVSLLALIHAIEHNRTDVVNYLSGELAVLTGESNYPLMYRNLCRCSNITFTPKLGALLVAYLISKRNRISCIDLHYILQRYGADMKHARRSRSGLEIVKQIIFCWAAQKAFGPAEFTLLKYFYGSEAITDPGYIHLAVHCEHFPAYASLAAYRDSTLQPQAPAGVKDGTAPATAITPDKLTNAKHDMYGIIKYIMYSRYDLLDLCEFGKDISYAYWFYAPLEYLHYMHTISDGFLNKKCPIPSIKFSDV